MSDPVLTGCAELAGIAGRLTKLTCTLSTVFGPQSLLVEELDHWAMRLQTIQQEMADHHMNRGVEELRAVRDRVGDILTSLLGAAERSTKG